MNNKQLFSSAPYFHSHSSAIARSSRTGYELLVNLKRRKKKTQDKVFAELMAETQRKTRLAEKWRLYMREGERSAAVPGERGSEQGQRRSDQ